MATEKFVNLVQTSLPSAITSGQTSITVASASGLPSPQFRVSIDDEILLVTGVAGTTLTATRGTEGTTAAGHPGGSLVTLTVTAGSLLNCPRSMTATGDLETLDGSGTLSRVALGANARVLASNGTAFSWQPAAGTPLTGQALVQGGASGAGFIYGSNRGFNPRDFGAFADGTNHPLSGSYGSLAAAQVDFPFATALTESIDRCALQRCFDLAKTTDTFHFGKNVYIPAGIYFLDKMMTIDTVYGMTVRGDGLATTLSWRGGTVSTAVIKIILSELCSFESFLLTIGDGSLPHRGIWLTNRTGASDGIVSTHAVFRHVRIAGQFDFGVDIAYDVLAGAGDNNNDLHVFESCEIAQYSSAGVHVNGGQSHFLRFLCSDFVALSSVSSYGFWSVYGCYAHFHLCNFQSNTIDIRLDQFFPGVCSSVRSNCENSRSHLATSPGGGHVPAQVVEVIGCRLSMLPQSTPDYIFDFNHNGPIVVRDNFVTTTNGQPPLLAVRFAANAVTHVNNIYQTQNTGPAWTSSALRLPNGGTIPSFQDVGNLYFDPNSTSHQYDSASWFATTPAALAANTDNYNPGQGLVQLWSASSPVNVTGMLAGFGSEVREVFNTGTSTITLVNGSGGSSAANRFRTDTGTDISLLPNATVRLVYDSTASLWRAASFPGSYPPRLTTAQRDALVSPPEGLLIYNTTTKAMNFFNGTIWVALL